MEPSPKGTLRREPFRLFFPVGVLLSWVGVGHWLLYALGASQTYSCDMHALIQLQAFLPAFALGFLLTAIPRRTDSASASGGTIAVLALGLVTVTGAAVYERWALVHVTYLGVLALLVGFAIRRLLGGGAGRRPPANFVLIPLGLLQGAAGALLLLGHDVWKTAPWTAELGRLLITQGVFLCFIIGVGSLVLPLMSGAPPPPDLSSSPRERRKLLAYAAAGVVIAVTLAAEVAGYESSMPLLRAIVVAAGIASAPAARRRPGRPGVTRHLVWLAVWLTPLGLAVSGLWPEYRVPALHVTFIGGFALMAFGVATHVTLSHVGLEALRDANPRPVVIMGAALLLAMTGRVVADWSDTYFEHLGAAAVAWLVGSGVWLAFVTPKMLRGDE